MPSTVVINNQDSIPVRVISDTLSSARILLAERSIQGPAGADGPQGEPGPPGPPGEGSATVTIGTTTTGDAGTDAIVVNSGTTTEAILDFTIPRGEQGLQGTDGADGQSFVWRGAWSLGLTLAYMECVSHNWSAYVCIQSHLTTALTEPGVGADWELYWQVLAQGYNPTAVGDMKSLIYDPRGIASDVYDAATLTGNLDAGVFT